MSLARPILGNSDSLQLFPLGYPWAWDMYLQNMSNHWTPNEIPVADDVAQWRREGQVSDAERHVFRTLMEQLTTFDVQRGDETAETLQLLLNPPEMKQFLKRLADEEALHTWSYQYIIENFGLDQDEIYTAYNRIPQMRARVDLANECSFSAKAIAARHVLDPERRYTIREQQDILYALIFWFLCFEGVWFVMGLSGPLQALARQGKFRRAAEQFQYILRDEFQHIRFGVLLIQEFIRQHPTCMTPAFVNDIKNLFRKTHDLEAEFMQFCLITPIMGYNITDHMETTKFYINLRAGELGIESLYPGATDALPWRHEMLLGRKEKNFFETRVTEYQTGGVLRWD